MDRKAIVSNVAVAVVTAVIMGFIAWAAGVFEAGSDALEKDQIRAVIAEVLILDNGQTYGQALDSIDKSVGEINVSIGAIKEDVDDLEAAVTALASD